MTKTFDMRKRKSLFCSHLVRGGEKNERAKSVEKTLSLNPELSEAGKVTWYVSRD